MARSSLIPGFRFHPTDVELVVYYLKRKLTGKKISSNAVTEVNIYDYSPWDLKDKSCLKSGDLEWYFFCPKSKKYSSGGRFNRATEAGFWKATGKDRKVEYNGRTVAAIKTLIFHLGHAGKGERTDWVMHEYRMEDEHLANAGVVQDMYVLCRIFEKSGSGPKNGAQYGAPFNEDEWNDDLNTCSDFQAIVGSVGASDATGHKQKGVAATSITAPVSSTVTFSANEPVHTPTDKQNGPVGVPDPTGYKQNGPAATNMTEPGSSGVPFSANEPTNYKQKGSVGAPDPIDYKQKGPAATKMTEPGSSGVFFSANEATNYKQKGLVGAPDPIDYKQKGPVATNMTEPGPSGVPFSANEPTSYMQSGPASMNVNQVTEPGSYGDDLICLDELYPINGVAANGEKEKTMNDADDFDFDNFFNFSDADLEYTIDGLLRLEEPDLGKFYVD